MTEVNWALKTDVGKIRKTNQDSMATLGPREMDGRAEALLVLADGMGGRAGGEVASRLAVDAVAGMVREKLLDDAGELSRQGLGDAVYAGLESANANVWQRARDDQALKGMGTTCVAALVRKDVAAIGNAGDSRVYLLRDAKLVLLTHDHVFLHNASSRETHSSESPRNRFHHTITRAIGFGATLEPDVMLLPLLEGDLLLLCSDGLTNTVKEDAIARLLREPSDAQQACDRLVAAANENGGEDNISVIVMHYGDYRGSKSPLATDTPNAVPQRISSKHGHRTRLTGHKLLWSLLGTIVLALVVGGIVLHLLHRL